MRWGAPILPALVLAGSAFALPPDQIATDLTARLEALAAAVADSPDRGAAALIAGADLAALAATTATDPDLGPVLGPVLTPGDLAVVPPLQWPAPPTGAPEGDRLDIRLALTMLSQPYGDDDNGAVLQAQTHPELAALVLTGGQARLADLGPLLAAQGLPGGMGPDGFTLSVPLVIWPGAGLTLTPGDRLLLSRADGAFLLNFGHLTLQGATIAGTGAINAQIRSFRPFVATADAGTLVVQDAEIRGLGFGNTLKFAGFSVLRSLLRPTSRPARIESSLFEDIRTLAISADQGVILQDNRLRNLQGPGIVIARSPGARVIGNLFSAPMATNAIRLEQATPDALVAGNVILGGDRAGILVRDGSPRARVLANLVWARDGGGIQITGAPCARVTANLVIGNRQKGIELRAAPGAWAQANSLIDNNNAALWVSDQAAGNVTLLSDNVVAFNGAGLAAARGATLLLTGNDLSRQYLQFLAGDLTDQASLLARDMQGLTPVMLSPTEGRPVTDAQIAAFPDPALECAP
jgi:mannuronan 5-epimerase